MEESFVTVHSTYDLTQAEILGDLLREAGLHARIIGTHPDAVFGATQGSAQSRIEVRDTDADEAREIVLAYLSADAPLDEAFEAPQDEQDEEDEPAGAPRLRGVLAGGVAMVLPGGSHLYARRAWIGAAIFAGQVCAISLMMSGSRQEGNVGAVVACGLFLFDLIGGQLAVRAYNRGTRLTPVRQLGMAAIVLMALGGLGTLMAPYLMRLRFHQRADSVEDNGTNSNAIRHRNRQNPDDLPFPLHMDLSH